MNLRFRICFATLVLTVIAGTGVANAQKETVKYVAFPTGNPALGGFVIDGGCVEDPAPETIPVLQTPATQPPTYVTYVFAFWNLNGLIRLDRTQTLCSEKTKKTHATAWYLKEGGGNCTPNCPPSFVTTFAFSDDHNESLPNTTPIKSVAPNSGTPPPWTSPSTTVLTNGPEAIAALPDISLASISKPGTEPFRRWAQVPQTSPPTPPSSVYQASTGSGAYVVAFYGPEPCQTLVNELAICGQEPGPGRAPGKCSDLALQLEACLRANGEAPPPR